LNAISDDVRREKFHPLEGESVMVLESDDGVLKHPPSSLRGRLKGKISTQTFEDEIRHIRKQWRL
jgi:hypothetical protein